MIKVIILALMLSTTACATTQPTGSPPCGIRGPEYTTPCIDDPTSPNAVASCPCNPEMLQRRNR